MNIWGGASKLTKYCSGAIFGNNGYTDTYTTLQPEDDAAEVNWGNGWRMATNEEWTELITNTNHQWTTMGGKTGMLLTSTDGTKSIFLPAAGYQGLNGSTDVGDNGRYWTSSLITEFPVFGHPCVFRNNTIGIDAMGRPEDYSVRPVRVSVPQN